MHNITKTYHSRNDALASSRRQTKKPAWRKWRLILKDDEEVEDNERTKGDEGTHFRVTIHKRSETLDEIFEYIRESKCMYRIKYDNMNDEENNKIEYFIIFMITKIKYTPLEIGDSIPEELLSKNWQKMEVCIEDRKKMWRRSLARLMFNFWKK